MGDEAQTGPDNMGLFHGFTAEGAGGAHEAPGASPAGASKMALGFTGSGWEYWRIWVVNLVLIVLTLGVYYPWAKARKLRYVYNNTEVGGDALDYHATGWRLFKGMVVASLLFGVLNVLGQLSLVLLGLTTVAFWLVLPLLWRASLHFRLAQSSWRGLRFAFVGSSKGAFVAFYWPWLVALVALGAVVAAGALVAALVGWGVVAGHDEASVWAGLRWLGLAALWAATVAALTVSVLAWVYGVRRYQHNHYAFGNLGSELVLSWSAFMRQAWRPVAWGLVGLSLLVVVLIYGTFANPVADSPAKPWGVLGIATTLYLGLPVLGAYWSAVFQNVFWSATRAPDLRFHSALSPWAFAGLVLKNLLLTLLTLGLYWPFATMATMRARVLAMSLHSDVDWAHITARAAGEDNSLGDMALDAGGFDFGL